jgi:two-component sensor histidine kinase
MNTGPSAGMGDARALAQAIAPYLARLCETLAASMIGDSRPILLIVRAQDRAVSSNEPVSIGLIVTELVINALKHAFQDDRTGSEIVVTHNVAEPNWRLAVSDNGIGRAHGQPDTTTPGLGTSIVGSLAKQLDAHVEISMTPDGTSVSITHGTMPSLLPPLRFPHRLTVQKETGSK